MRRRLQTYKGAFVFEPKPGLTPLWQQSVMEILFGELELAMTAVTHLALHHPYLCVKLEEIPNQDWERLTLNQFQPECFADKLWICPSWHTPPVADAVNVILDPGLAFGTGNHPTTKLCLQWLANSVLIGKKVVDYGCGSGILALAAAKLGASVVQAIDHDLQALQATRSNSALNVITDQLVIIDQPANLHKDNNIIIANIILNTIIELKHVFKYNLLSKGQLIISGILKSQVDQVLSYYNVDFVHERSQYLEEWVLLEFRTP